MSNSEIDLSLKMSAMGRQRQRKFLESSTTSVNQSLNASFQLLNLTTNVNDSFLNATNVPYGNVGNVSTNGSKTPGTTPTRLNTSRTTPGGKLNTSQNQKKTPKTPSQGGDRYIPCRNALNMEISHFLVTQSDNFSKENKPEVYAAAGNKISEAMNVDLNNFRIVNCQDRVESSNGLKLLYSSGKQLATVKKQAPRNIPAQPERILDAPDILNDYYLQLVDWSENNVLAVALNRELYLWNAATGDIENLLQTDESDYIASVAWVDNSDNIAVGLGSGTIQIWDAGKKKKMRTMKGHSTRVASLSWNSHLLTSGSRGGEIFNHDVRIQDHHIGSMNFHTQEVCGLKWSPNGKYLASGGNDNTICVWGHNISNDSKVKPIYTFKDNTSAVKAIAWSPWKTNLLATGAGAADRRIRIWNVNDGSNVHSIDTDSQVCGIVWSKEYKELISAHSYPNNELNIWKYPEMTKVTDLTGHTQRVLDVVMSPDGSTVVSVGADETLRFWECFQVDSEKKKEQEVKAYKEQIANGGLRATIR
ncbi:cell division cycle protein 20-like protein [Leptotrombidium deliense]|uniref:Cell division cycle protein 20-like protein n=1 Tax=Leptotrombidium deliense TaxID=299467 RepID=A0A443SRX1_9ACAR|nr:cell division cycle protein 20-like protein [Leptotrombidium deliense]